MANTSSNRVPILAKNGSLSKGVPKSDDSWHSFTQVNNYVNSLELSSLDVESGDVYSIIKGVPSPWVRAYMTKNAIGYPFVSEAKKIEKVNLKGMDFLYGAIQDEYKGILACMALYSNRIKVEKVELKYTDDLKYNELSGAMVLKSVKNIYEISGAFGNMLFDQEKFWKPINNTKDKNTVDQSPYVLLISIDDTVFAGSNPMTLLYPAANYNLNEADIPFYVKKRFRNPSNYLQAVELEKLFHYLTKLRENVNNFEKEFKDPEFNIITVHSFLRDFQNEVKDKLVEINKEFNDKKSGILDFSDKFKNYSPFDKLFDIDVKIYRTKDGRYLINNETGDLPEFNPDKLLLPLELSQILMIKQEKEDECQLASTLCARGSDGVDYYFSLPFSSLGLKEFQNQLMDILGKGQSGLKYDKILTARYDVEKNELDVTLKLEISGFDTYFSKKYPVSNAKNPIDTNIILWPNFYANNWTEYYLYSEIPHEGKGIKSIPLVADENNLEALKFTSDSNLYYLTEDKNSKASCIVEHSFEKLKEKKIKYEIFKSNVPFLGVELRTSSEQLNDYCCGYILISHTANSATSLRNHSFDRRELESAQVSIDFGSTNTSISMVDRTNTISSLKILPRRVFVLGCEKNDNSIYATTNQIFFFQNDLQSNALRSALVLHNTLRLSDYELQHSQAISGGVTLQERNIPITGGDRSALDLRIDDEETKVIYDLKWKREDKYLVNKKAYLKNVWLCVCAELFTMGKKPNEVMWSYPHAMPKDLRRTYEGIYEEVIKNVNPIHGAKAKTAKITGQPNSYSLALSESEAVCNYALTMGGIGLQSDSIFLGIDIGGVTSDLLLLTNDPGDKRALLLKQSSVKIAGDRISKAIGASKSIQKCIAHFVRREKLSILGLENLNDETSAYYTNQLFESLENNSDLERAFYSELWDPENEELNRDETRGLIAVATYVCGLLLFHAAQLTASIVKKDAESGKPQLNLGKGFNLHVSTFGKGGKLFDWLPTALGKETAENFYKECFEKGLEIYDFPLAKAKGNSSVLKYLNYTVKKENLKNEVSLGLACPRGLVSKSDFADFEILGEFGYTYDENNASPVSMEWDAKMENKLIFELGEKLHFPEIQPTAENLTGLKRFDEFLKVYVKLVSEWELFDHSKLAEKANKFVEINLENYVKSDEDWVANNQIRQKTKNDSDFRFSSSPFLFEGMCFLDEVLMKSLYVKE
jgi:hypothetical protein